jgi:hypothetical protein
VIEGGRRYMKGKVVGNLGKISLGGEVSFCKKKIQ